LTTSPIHPRVSRIAAADRSGGAVTVFDSSMRRTLLSLLVVALVAAPAAAAQTDLQTALTRQMRHAGAYSGAYVVNLATGEKVYAWRAGRPRILASNTKLFVAAAALARFGTEGTLGTEVLGRGAADEDGVFRGDLYLRGGGDPTFGSRGYTRRAFGHGATVEGLAALLDEAGIERVTGRVYGDESQHDTLRGGPYSAFGISSYVGPLSALSFNHGLALGAFQTDPAAFAAARLDAALEARGIRVRRKPRVATAPAGAQVLASVDSPPMQQIVRLMNKPSDNFFAEILIKDLAMQANGRGTTAAGAALTAGFARELRARARIADGSGLSRGNRASPFRVVRLLTAMAARDEFDAFYASLPVAGRDGTLSTRMRSGPARGRCRGKTGTLSNVSALSGYCTGRASGETYAYSILMNGVYTSGAKVLQDRMLQALAARG
jgi:serine-type D-Ala-D-Ala carboxypeptidase/endopeptidase (penicillin-binding protein 4)